MYWGVGADVVEVDTGVADGHHGAEAAEGLADKDSDGCAGADRCERGDGQEQRRKTAASISQ
jgi:hypothetical protein